MSSAKDIAAMKKMLARNEARIAAETAPREQPTPTRAAQRLNAHHERFGAGFYPSAICSRAFGARVRKGGLEITDDFKIWQPVDLSKIFFTDSNGRKIHI